MGTAMRLTQRLLRLFDTPAIEVSVSECRACEVRLSPDMVTCPDCGGEVLRTTEERVPMYWGLD